MNKRSDEPAPIWGILFSLVFIIVLAAFIGAAITVLKGGQL